MIVLMRNVFVATKSQFMWIMSGAVFMNTILIIKQKEDNFVNVTNSQNRNIHKMEKEFNLSEKVNYYYEDAKYNEHEAINVEDVKEFIRLLKARLHHEIFIGIESGYIDEELWHPHKNLFEEVIDKLAGDKLK